MTALVRVLLTVTCRDIAEQNAIEIDAINDKLNRRLEHCGCQLYGRLVTRND
jgi:ketopantoate reductase